MMDYPIRITWLGDPRTKKNSMRIYRTKYGYNVLPSEQYKEYEKLCLMQTKATQRYQIDEPINIECNYYRKTKRTIDLVNLQATSDILVEAGIIKDDNSKIIQSYDGSRIKTDKNNPRVEIESTRIEE